MEYEEALELKRIVEKETIMETGYEYLFLIVPSSQEDFLNFLTDYNEETYVDEDCKKYSKNGDYKLFHKMTEESVNRFIKRRL